MFRSKRLYPIFIFVLFLAGFEVSLQLISFVGRKFYFHADDQRNHKAVRILTLGESTTADLGAIPPSSSWPRQLEEMLNKSHQVQVVNKGDVATNTTAIISALPGYVDRYEPQIVIAMMGVNDQGLMGIKNQYLPVYASKGWRVLSYELIKNLYRYLQSRIDKRAEKDRERFFQVLNHQFEKQDVKVDELIAFSETLSLQERLHYLDQLPFFILRNRLGAQETFKQVLSVYEKRLALAFDDDAALEFLYYAKQTGDIHKCTWLLELVTSSGLDVELKTLGRFVDCLGRTPKLTEYIARRGDLFIAPLDQREGLTKRNHLTLYRYLKRRGICLIVMAYPLGKIKPQDYFVDTLNTDEENEALWFIDNDKIFQAALREKSLNDLFYDLFAQDFGHTTPLGSSLIAKNVYQLVKQILKEEKCINTTVLQRSASLE